jgi:hypothetical protein
MFKFTITTGGKLRRNKVKTRDSPRQLQLFPEPIEMREHVERMYEKIKKEGSTDPLKSKNGPVRTKV